MANDRTAPEVAGIRRRPRPAFLNLLQLQMPVGSITSIGHRISGVLLAASLPCLLWLLGESLRGADGYARVGAIFDHWAVRGVLVLWVWVLAHHLLAGIRHLLSDIDIGSRLQPARRSAWIVNVAGVVVALLAAGALL